ncbi:hypothetical protein Arub01_17240 [Actinomadura rubrobrunea]|uniref:Uncharacterized protein n=1 Tax=Actinomadura rubrobrunea TaxID=115335 RepID=A0A9W6PTM9_9ACTN|nr:hypothetical protein Arub01_17240 [Actinomadura rubrobrunea]
MRDGLADVHRVEVARRTQAQHGLAVQVGVQEPVDGAVLEDRGRGQSGHGLRIGAKAVREAVGRFRHGGRRGVRVPLQPYVVQGDRSGGHPLGAAQQGGARHARHLIRVPGVGRAAELMAAAVEARADFLPHAPQPRPPSRTHRRESSIHAQGRDARPRGLHAVVVVVGGGAFGPLTGGFVRIPVKRR